MIRPQEGVRKPNSGGRPGQDSEFICHHASPTALFSRGGLPSQRCGGCP
jgi:hypothetical protein